MKNPISVTEDNLQRDLALNIDGSNVSGAVTNVTPQQTTPESALDAQIEGKTIEDAKPRYENAVDSTPEPPQEEEGASFGDFAADVGLFGLRGVEGFVESVGGLFGSKWDRDEWSVFGKSKTLVGSFGENIVQFGIGMIPGLGTAGLVSKAAKLGKVAKMAKTAKAAKGAKQAQQLEGVSSVAKGNRTLGAATMQKLAKMKPAARRAAVFGYAGAVSDFVAFKGQEARLSNILTEWGADSELLKYLSYDPEQDNNEYEERLKNSIEGLFVGGIAGGAIGIISKGIKKFRRKNELVSKGTPEEEAIETAEREFIADVTSDKDAVKDMTDLNATIAREKILRENGSLPAPFKTEELPFKTEVDELPLGGGEKPPKKKAAPIQINGKVAKEKDVDGMTEAQVDEFLTEYGDMDIPSVSGSLATKKQIAKDIIKGGEDALQTTLDLQGVVEAVVESNAETFLKTTGDQAAMSARKLFDGLRSTEGLTALFRAVSKKAVSLRTELHGKPKNAQELYDRNEGFLLELDHTDLFDRDLAQQQLENARGNVEDLEKIYAEQNAIYKLYNYLAEEVGHSVDRAIKSKSTKETITYEGIKNGKVRDIEKDYKSLLTDVYQNLDFLLAAKELWAQYGTHLSMGMLQRRFIYEGTGSGGMKYKSRHLGFALKKDVDPNAKKSTVQQLRESLYRKGIRGSRSESKFLRELEQAKNSGDIGAALSKLGADSRNGFARTMGYYLNALLSSPVTWGVNMVGSALMKAFRDFEMMAGAMGQYGMTGNADLLKARIKATFDMESFLDAWKYAAISLKAGEPRSVAGFVAYSDNRFEDLKSGWVFGDADSKNPLTTAGNWLGNLVSGPSRVLMAGDELFKQWNYRSYVKSDLAMEAHRRGIKNPTEIAAYVRDNFENYVTKEGRFMNEANVYKEASAKADDEGLRFGKRTAFIDEYMDENFYSNNMRLQDGTIYKTTYQRDMLVDRATDWALINTFTNTPENGFARWVSTQAMASPWLAFAIPFVRTPTNILTFALSRVLPLPGLGRVHHSKAREFNESFHQFQTDKGYRSSLNPFLSGEYAVETTKRYAAVAEGKAPGVGAPNEAISKYENSPYNEPKIIEEVIPESKAAAFFRATEGPTGTIHIDKKRVREMYERKAWQGKDPRVKGVKPIPDEYIQSYEDFEEFVIEHERAHQYLKQRHRKNESTVDYENRINKEALKRMDANKEGGKGWQKELQRLYADTPFTEAMVKEHRDLQIQGDAVKTAEHIGRLTTSAMMTASVAYTVELVKDRVTGSPPKGLAAKRAWEAVGKKPYSILVGSGKDAKWVSYQKMDPFATILGIFADTVHMSDAAFRNEGQELFADTNEKAAAMKSLQKVYAIVATTFYNNITNGSYVEGLYNVMEMFKDMTKADKMVGSILGGMVPTGLTWTENLVEEEPQIYEARKILDHVMKRIPAYMRPDVPETIWSSASLMPKRNWLGEKVRKQGPFLPSFVGAGMQVPHSFDIVDQEILALGKGFNQRGHLWAAGTVDSRMYRNEPAGQTAYDRHQELMSTRVLGGRTLRQSLRALIQSNDYQQLPPATDMTIGKQHPRSMAIGRILAFYSADAKNKVLEEYPKLRAHYYESINRK